MKNAMRENDENLYVGVLPQGEEDFDRSRYTVPKFPSLPGAPISPLPSAYVPQRARRGLDDSPKLKESEEGFKVGGTSSPAGDEYGEAIDTKIVDEFMEQEGINRSKRLRERGYGYKARTRDDGSGLDMLLNKRNAAPSTVESSPESFDGSAFGLGKSPDTGGSADNQPDSPCGTYPRRHRNTFEVGFLEEMRSSLDFDDSFDDDDDDEKEEGKVSSPHSPTIPPRRVRVRRGSRGRQKPMDTISGSPAVTGETLESRMSKRG